MWLLKYTGIPCELESSTIYPGLVIQSPSYTHSNVWAWSVRLGSHLLPQSLCKVDSYMQTVYTTDSDCTQGKNRHLRLSYFPSLTRLQYRFWLHLQVHFQIKYHFTTRIYLKYSTLYVRTRYHRANDNGQYIFCDFADPLLCPPQRKTHT